MLNKSHILGLVVELLRREEAVLIQAGLAAQEAATEPEAKPENQYDTRGLEQSYLAAGQARRLEAVRNSVLVFRTLPLQSFDQSSPIEVSALVQLEDEGGDRKIYFILPSFGGVKIKCNEREIFTLSPESPLGSSLMGKLVGDSIEIKNGGQIRSYSILSVE